MTGQRAFHAAAWCPGG